MKLSLAFSPCPNDTFLFFALATGRVRSPHWDLSVHFHDVETLNQAAMEGRYDITKLSFHAYLAVRQRYHLLQAGAALGFGCGPLLVARHPLTRAEVEEARIAVPGELTTAHLLLRLWAPGATRKIFVSYDRVLDLVLRGEADCGLLIHEGRFVYAASGLHCLVDLGQWWETMTQLPLPLGGMALRRDREDMAEEVEGLFRQSLAYAQTHRTEALEFARGYAQEMDEKVLEQHIATFVTEQSVALDPQGLAALRRLEEMARQQGIAP